MCEDIIRGERWEITSRKNRWEQKGIDSKIEKKVRREREGNVLKQIGLDVFKRRHQNKEGREMG